MTVAFGTATAVQFFLNRKYSFAAFDRYVLHQMGTYFAVSVVQWLMAVSIVQVGVTFLHMAPLLAKAISVPPTAIAGFLANRTLTFGPAKQHRETPDGS